MKKELDLAQIMRDSIMKANKDLGFLKEAQAQESAFDEDFDPKKHMPSLALTPKKWGAMGTIEAKQLDAVLKNLIPSGEDGIARFKQGLLNLNKSLGTTFGKTGKSEFPTYEDQTGGASSINEIVSGLIVKSLMHNLIVHMPASAAGTAFEGFISRFAGGYLPNEGDNPIQDFVDANGNFISLKLVIGTTGIQGSLANLAKGVATAPQNKVIYLVCVKDKDNDPFKITTYSFEVNEGNFFKLASGVLNPSPEIVSSIKQKIYKELGVATTVAPTNTSEIIREALTKDYVERELTKKYEEIFKQYFINNNSDKEPTRPAIRAFVNSKIDQSETLTEQEFQLFKQLVAKRHLDKDGFGKDPISFKEKLKKEIFIDSDAAAKLVKAQKFSEIFINLPAAIAKASDEEIEDILRSSDTGKKYIKDIEASSLEKEKQKTILDNSKIKVYQSFLKDNSVSDLGQLEKKIPSDQKDKLDKQAEEVSKTQYERTAGALYKRSGTEARLEKAKEELKAEFLKVKEKLKPIVNMLAEIEEVINQVAPQPEALTDAEKKAKQKIEKPAETPEAATASEEAQKLFFKYLKGYYSGNVENAQESLSEAETTSGTQFSIAQSSVKQLAKPIDYDYPQIIIDKSELFGSAQKNAEVFKDWIEPIYRGMHYLTQGVNQYFVEDLPIGLVNAEEKGIKEVKNSIDKFKTKQAGGQGGGAPKASQVDQQQPTQQTESKKTSLNDDFLSDILKDLI